MSSNPTTITKINRPTLSPKDRRDIAHKILFLRYAFNIGLIDISSYREGRNEANRQVLILTHKSTHKDRSSTPILVHEAPNDISNLGDKS